MTMSNIQHVLNTPPRVVLGGLSGDEAGGVVRKFGVLPLPLRGVENIPETEIKRNCRRSAETKPRPSAVLF